MQQQTRQKPHGRQKMTDKKRYAVFTSFYIWAKDDADAIQIAKYRAAMQDRKNDDMCTTDEIRNAHGTAITRPVIYKRNEETTN